MFAVTAILLRPGQARSNGAPSGACINLIPSPGSHGGGQAGQTPYVLSFTPELNGTVYTPGQTYTVTLSGSNGEQFRGFLVQVRSAPGDDPATLGGITENSGDVQPHACSPSDGGVTHINNNDKMSISFQWTPIAGTGDVVFRYTVVRTQPVHWDAASTSTFQELVGPTDPPVSTTVGIIPNSVIFSATPVPNSQAVVTPSVTPMTPTGAGTSTAVPVTSSMPTNCSGGINLGQWSATWTVIGLYATFTVSGSSTGGYVAIGFSDSRSMPNSDIILGASDGSSSFVDDRYAASRSNPPSDASQDVNNTSVMLANNRLSFTFTRRLDTGDAQGDIVLGVRETMCRYILFAAGTVTDIATRSIAFHGTRNALSSNQVCLCQSPLATTGTPPTTSSPSATTPSGVGWRATSFSVLVLLIIAAVHCLL